MTNGVDHVLLTRFNLPSDGPESVIRAQEGWLRNRVGLFDRYCIPSVLGQTNQNFHWIIYFDPASPAWLHERIDRYRADGVFVPILRATVDHGELVADIAATLGTTGSTLITTNLDNDDGLAIDFVERLQAVTPAHDRVAVYLTVGLISSAGALYLRRDRRNAFCSVRETWNDPATCWADWHNLLGDSMPVLELAGSPAWLQVVHGANVSNRVRGRLVSPTGYATVFGDLLAGTRAPSRRDVVRDRFLEGPARAFREGPRAAAKWIALRLLGKTGLDRIKLRLIGDLK
jgi:N-acetylglucosaminyl-diphospho-decaprenol L-rhamnosyltransferase